MIRQLHQWWTRRRVRYVCSSCGDTVRGTKRAELHRCKGGTIRMKCDLCKQRRRVRRIMNTQLMACKRCRLRWRGRKAA